MFICYVLIDKSCLKGLFEDGVYGIMVFICFEFGLELDVWLLFLWVFRDGGMFCGGVEVVGDVIWFVVFDDCVVGVFCWIGFGFVCFLGVMVVLMGFLWVFY